MMSSHEELLRHALRGLEGDLDELRETLTRQMRQFEGGLKQHVAQMPVWLELPYGRVHQMVRFPQDGSFQGALLGPRAVALAAGEIEQFIRTWIGQGEELVDLERALQPHVARPWGRDLSLLALYLDNMEHEAQAVMIAARTSLMHTREEIVAELEERRRADSEALEELVSRGDLEQGNQARREIAELWEEQRRRADTFSRRWEQLERHVEGGLDVTENGLDTLRELLENANTALSQAHPGASEEGDQAERAQGLTPARMSRTPRSSLELFSQSEEEEENEPRDFDPYGEPVSSQSAAADEQAPLKAALALSSGGSRRAINEDFFKSEEVNDDLVFASEGGLEGPMIDFGEADPEREGASHQLFAETLRAPPSESAQSSSPYEIFLSDEPEPKPEEEPARRAPSRSPQSTLTGHPRLALASEEREIEALEEPEQDAWETLPLGLEEPPLEVRREEEQGEASQVEEIETLELSRDALEEQSGLTQPILPATMSPPPEAASGPSPVGDEVGDPLELKAPPDELEEHEEGEHDLEPEREPVVRTPEREAFSWQAEGERRRQVNRPIGALELALALGLPVGLILALVAQAAWAAQLSERWLASSVVARGAAFAACAWLAIGPLLFLQWKLGWRGDRVTPYRAVRLRDEADLVIEGERLEIGDESIARGDVLESALERWEARRGGERGLMLTLRSAHDTVVLYAQDDHEIPGVPPGHALPLGRPPGRGDWEVSELTLSQVRRWSVGDKERLVSSKERGES